MDYVEIVKMAGIGIVSGFFGAYLNSLGHRYQKWWEIRAACYMELIEALSDSVHSLDELKSYEESGVDPTEARKCELVATSRAALTKIRKAANMGSFVFSEQVNMAIRELLTPDDDHRTYQRLLQANVDGVRKCLKIAVSASIEDLKIKSPKL